MEFREHNPQVAEHQWEFVFVELHLIFVRLALTLVELTQVRSVARTCVAHLAF